MKKIERIIRKALNTSKRALEKIHRAEVIVKKGEAFGDVNNDTEIRADVVLGEIIQDVIAGESISSKIGIKLTREGYNKEHVKLSEKKKRRTYSFFVDQLDGSLNRALKGDTIGLPYSACITAFAEEAEVFKDIVAAGIIDLRSGDLWLTHKDKEGGFDTSLNGKRVHTADIKKIDLGKMIVIGEMYYPSNREKLLRVFSGEKGWLRNPGSAAYEMALVFSGQAVAFICDQQKHHELGAGYALVKGAGGAVVDFQGYEYDPRPYNFKVQSSVILAANKAIAKEIVLRMNR